MAITYDYYRIFYHVAQCRSFTRAAEVLSNNQPNITRCMNNLEQELGCKLFVRSHQGVALTPEGRRLFLRVAAAYEQLRLGEEEIQRDCSLDTGTISIGTNEVALHLLLLDKLSAFHEKFPGVHIRITSNTTPQAIEALTQGRADCAVVTTPNEAKKPLRETRLRNFREVLLCSVRNRELASQVRRLRDVVRYPFIGMGVGTSAYTFYQRLFVKQDLSFHVDIEAASVSQILPMVRHNLGIGFFSEILAAPAIARGEVCQVRLVESVPERAVTLVEDASRPQSIAMKTFRQMLLTDQPLPDGRESGARP